MLSFYNYKATLVRVIDGDTVEVDIDLGFDRISTRRKLRLLDVNTPERGQPGYDEASALVKATLVNCDQIAVHTVSKDSFGRWLADIWCDDLHLNQMLIEMGWPYKK